jgi:DNA replication protein DnaC
MKIDEVISKMKFTIESDRIDAMKKRPSAPGLNFPDFRELLILECTRALIIRRIFKPFKIDKENEIVIDDLFHYLTFSEGFRGDLQKGILLLGGLGTGKTILLKGFAGIIELLTGKIFLPFLAQDLNKILVKEETTEYNSKYLLIDDLGKEQEYVNNYGTIQRPILELFASRYDNGALTFATSNYKVDTFTKKYGAQTVDRFKEMFNIMELLGNSRRT